MAYDIGPVIGIEGEKEFRDAIKQINNNMKTLGTEMEVVTSEFDKNDKSAEALTAQNKVLNKQIEEQKNKLSELKKGLEASADKYGENDKVTQGWRQAVNKATADLNKMEREVKTNTKAIDEFGKEAEKTTVKTGRFSGSLSGLTKGLGKGLVVATKAAVVAIAAVGTAAVAATVGAIKLTARAGEAADELITLANKTGLTVKQLQEFQYASRFVDVEVETMTSSMARLIRSMDSAKDGNKSMVSAFQTLKIKTVDANGALRDSKEVFFETIDALGKVKNETERNALAMTLFGKSAQDLNPLIKAGSAELNRLAKEAADLGLVLSDEQIAKLGEFDDSMQKLQASSKGLGNVLAIALLPGVKSLIESVQGITKSVIDAIKTGDWSKVGTEINSAFSKAMGGAKTFLPVISEMIGGMLKSLGESMPTILPKLAESIVSLLKSWVESLKANGPALLTAWIQVFMILINGLTSILPELIPVAVQMILTLVQGLLDNLPQLVDAAIVLVLGLIDGLIKALPLILEQAPQIIETLINGIVIAIPQLVDASIKIIIALIDFLLNNMHLLGSAAGQIIVALVAGLIKAIPDLVFGVLRLIDTIKEQFGRIDWSTTGKNIIQGIIDGIKGSIGKIGQAAKEAAKSALDGAKKFLGIHSPSRVMRDQVGKMVGLGMAEGIASSARQVDAAMAGLNQRVVGSGDWYGMDDFKPSPKKGPNGSGSVEGSLTTIIKVPVIVDGKTIAEAEAPYSNKIQGANLAVEGRGRGI